jgi:hypothetical protein
MSDRFVKVLFAYVIEVEYSWPQRVSLSLPQREVIAPVAESS